MRRLDLSKSRDLSRRILWESITDFIQSARVQVIQLLAIQLLAIQQFGGVAEWQTRLTQNQVPYGSGGSTPLAAIESVLKLFNKSFKTLFSCLLVLFPACLVRFWCGFGFGQFRFDFAWF